MVIGVTSAWFPSRKSTLHQTGGCVRVRDGQRRPGKSMGGQGRYFVLFFIANMVPLLANDTKKSPLVKAGFTDTG
jgi:hypothetical protein